MLIFINGKSDAGPEMDINWKQYYPIIVQILLGYIRLEHLFQYGIGGNVEET